ncbi:MAG: hypothetical protein AB1782_03740 [Cyanobacteriota bacterium]
MLKSIDKSNITFQAKIKFIPYAEFEKKFGIDKTGIDFNDKRFCYDTKDRAIINGREVYTSCIQVCVAGGITDKKNAVMWHFNPGKVLGVLKNKMTKLKKDIANNLHREQLEGLIIGGSPTFLKSQKVFLELMKLFSSVKSNLEQAITLLWHSNSQLSAASYEAKSDTWSIGVFELNKYGKDKDSIIRRLKEVYSDIKVSDSDTVYLNEQKVENKELNTKNHLWLN